MSIRNFFDVRVAVLFGILGPFLGFVVYSGIFVAGKNPDAILVYVSKGAHIVLLLAYIFGSVPALCAGVAFGFIRRAVFKGAYPSYAICSLLAGLAGFATTFVFIGVAFEEVVFAALMGLIGLFAGGICGLVAKRRNAGSRNSIGSTLLPG